ncbi:MAG: hypothetical protein EXR72_00490 [Myxococcales bacterium]|nr:hypothetical protein [Myxococcales bacterium]
MSRWQRKLITLVLGGFAFITLTAEIRPDEFECEQAASHLADCCPDFDPGTLYCEHYYGCGSSREPDLLLAESDCILARDCNELVAAGVCERARQVNAPRTTTRTTPPAKSRPLVCQ